MREDKSIEAAVLNTLYVDLVRGIREQRSLERKHQSRQPPQKSGEKLREYEVMMRAVLSDGLAHPLEKAMVRDFALKNNVDDADHERTLQALGWTLPEWERGVRATVEQNRSSLHHQPGPGGVAAGGEALALPSGGGGGAAGGAVETSSLMHRMPSSDGYRKARIQLSHSIASPDAVPASLSDASVAAAAPSGRPTT